MLSPLEETLVLKENKTSTTSALAPKVIISGVLWGSLGSSLGVLSRLLAD